MKHKMTANQCSIYWWLAVVTFQVDEHCYTPAVLFASVHEFWCPSTIHINSYLD